VHYGNGLLVLNYSFKALSISQVKDALSKNITIIKQ